MLGPLTKYYRATGHGPALELALILKNKAASEFFLADGEFDPGRFVTTHVHSITCVLSSLAQLADLLGDSSLLGRVKAFYDKGLWRMRDAIGWTPESLSQQDSDHGEANNTGDILETALILGRLGHSACYHDAERILRCHLLPSQLLDTSFVENPANPAGHDGLRDVADRHIGAFGFPAPYGHQSVGRGRGNLSFNMDIVGGAVGSLCEAYREVTRYEENCHWVNLLFDHETEALRLGSRYTHGSLCVEVKRPGALFLRVPPWVDRAEIRVEGYTGSRTWTGDYLFFSQVPVGQEFRLRYPLRESTVTLSGALHIHPIRVRLRGDEVTGMENLGADLTFFDPYE